MSFGSSGFGSGGFGSTNNNASTGFGGFGNTNNTTGFGSSNQTGGFGTSNNSGSIFGSGTGGFGSTSNNNNTFGQNKTTFGSAGNTGGGIFGGANNAASTSAGNTFGSGGFGSTNNTGGFGSGASGGLFGSNANKSGFGSNTGGLFGGNNPPTAQTSTFGSSNNTSTGGLFGNQSASAFGSTQESQGTGGTPFQPFQEKEQNSALTNHFQSITFMQPYQKHSFEEHRLADYARGQKQGNANGQPGAFGASTGFGGTGGFGSSNQVSTGFGANNSTGGGLFGTNSAPPAAGSAFGNTGNATSGGFGSGGGGLFGSNQTKPTTGGLFGGATSNTGSSTGTGLFGAQNNTGFGQHQQSANPGGIFGGNNATKPSGSLFGGGSAGTSTGFGNTNNSGGGGLFGGTGALGSTQQNASPFGQAANTSANPFPATQQKSGIFGSAPTGQTGGLFGGTNNQQQQPQQQPAQTGSTLFGNQPPPNQTGGLFGAPKPTGSLFGNTSGTTLFGSTQQQQASGGGGMFGSNQQSQQPAAGNSLFGPNQNQNAGGSIFGNSSAQTQANNSIFGAANSQNANNQQPTQNPLQAPKGFSASLNDPSPYGSASIFHGLPPPPQNSPGPIATPIASGATRTRKVAALPQYKLNPSIASRLMTPQKRGYGFSYSTYGTPSSTTSTPGGIGGNLLSGSLGRSLGKSLSTSNLRNEGEPTSILAPGAFSASSQRYSATGSLKRLTIDRSLRTDLFNNSPPPAALPPATSTKSTDDLRGSALKKKVSFDTTPQEPVSSATERQSGAPSALEQGYLRSSTSVLNDKDSDANDAIDLTLQVQGNELAIVPEDTSPEVIRAKSRENLFNRAMDPEPGQYWSEPPPEVLKKMSSSELKAVRGLRIGRDNCGFVQFDEPVDLTGIDPYKIADEIVVIMLRQLTVYPDNVTKPPVGKGLNVPSTITLENSFPRSRDRSTPSFEKSGQRLKKHIERLKRVTDTQFVDYNVDTGEWTFKVPHFTTYGLDYDDDEQSDAAGTSLKENMPSQASPTPTPQASKVRGTSTSSIQQFTHSSALSSVPSDIMSLDPDVSGVSSSLEDDTFGYRRQRTVPGGFDEMSDIDGDFAIDQKARPTQAVARLETASDSGSDDMPEDNHDIALETENGADPQAWLDDEDMNMAGAFPIIDPGLDGELVAFSAAGTPTRLLAEMNEDWADQLQKTLSPRKQDRYLLKQSQAALDREALPVIDGETPRRKKQQKPAGPNFGEIKTSVDLMKSLFGQEELRRSGEKSGKTGFQWPYNRRDNESDPSNEISANTEFHNSFKVSFGFGNRIILRRKATQIVSKTVLAPKKERAELDLHRLQRQSAVTTKNGIPAAEIRASAFKGTRDLYESMQPYEAKIFELLSIVFDGTSDDELSKDIPESERPKWSHRIRKEKLARFWALICEPAATLAVKAAQTPEEKAFAFLTMNRVTEACEVLADGKDYRLATLIAQICSGSDQRTLMRRQMEDWSKSNNLSEFDDTVRALYTLLTGETCSCESKTGPVEDRVRGFSISQQFGLDWTRAFGLKLWYGILPDESLEMAVTAYAADLASGKETAMPTSQTDLKTISSRNNASYGLRHDVLWSILALAAEKNQVAAKTRLPTAFSPENITGNPVSYRLSFELHQLLAPRLPRAVDPVKADLLTTAFSSELESLNEWKYAIFVLMFIDDPVQRQRAIQTSLARIAPSIDDNEENLNFVFKELRLPQTWLWNAKALEARAAGDMINEAKFLARGHNWVEAHQVICEDVAPMAIIEQDHARLRGILDNFPAKHIEEWQLGGQVFSDFLQICDRKIGTPDELRVLNRLLATLAKLKPQKEQRRKLSFALSVALEEMTKIAVEKSRDIEPGMGEQQTVALLALPATQEIQREGLLKLGTEHFMATMARG